jgi:hypothetical protein
MLWTGKTSSVWSLYNMLSAQRENEGKEDIQETVEDYKRTLGSTYIVWRFQDIIVQVHRLR